jgi:hypothetical protein
MSHQLDLDGVLEKLVLLQHFAYGSKDYCRERLTGSEKDVGDGELDEYWAWVKGITSSYLLECAIRLRVLLDIIATGEHAGKVDGMDATARSGLVIGKILEGEFELTVREVCNKIIHARNVVPVWESDTQQESGFRYWSGSLELAGKKSGRDWRLLLHVAPWARSLQRFLDEAESQEMTLYVGQDWY